MYFSKRNYMNFSYLGFCFLIVKQKFNLIYMSYVGHPWVKRV
jgi:hypothetical protein